MLSLSLSLPPLLIVCLSVHVKSLYKVFRVLSRKLLASLKTFCMKAIVVRITNIIAKFQWKKIPLFLFLGFSFSLQVIEAN